MQGLQEQSQLRVRNRSVVRYRKASVHMYSQVGEYLGEVGEYCGDVGEYWGDVGEYWGDVGE